MTLEPIAIDALMFGDPNRLSPWVIPADRPAIVDPGPTSSVATVHAELERLGIDELGAIVMTHIHLDHAGGAGLLAEAHPGARLFIHERVAGLLVEPARLIEGVKAVWGDLVESAFGLPSPVAAERVMALGDSDRIDLGNATLEAIATPGHTRAHMAFLESEAGSLFVGDAIGVQVAGSEVVRSSTPPSDYSRSDTEKSIGRLAGIGAERLLLPHFGQARPDPETVLDSALEALGRWHEAFDLAILEEEPRSAFGEMVGKIEDVPGDVRDAFDAVNPAWLNFAGMMAERVRLERKAP
jgi:glyoxylase-like metal-dependent hydrolase (beta-lactamase superfamily II)